MIPYLIFAVSLSGLFLSIYLTLLPPPPFCEISSFLSCDTVLSSAYAKFLGVPTAFYGVVWFAMAASLSMLASNGKRFAKLALGWSVIGVAAVAVLTYVELVLIGAVCILCTAAHVLAIAVAALSFYQFKS
ncbi:MAG: vitamin K epoxide reductase family protein [Aigarchaeota archaeon]|nr:vitamin K epoxide reductase family protein [Candidatus Caldarchaeales archaeon]MDJ0273481.1 vitamin K epoxide reductase family protein [Candidatus Caldarchaeales archaeon]